MPAMFQSRTSLQTSLEQAENAIKQHEAFITTMDANDDKFNQVIHSADKLADEDHYAADKVRGVKQNVSYNCQCFAHRKGRKTLQFHHQ